MIDSVEWADIVPKQVLQWTLDTIKIVGRIQTGTANSSDFSLCWIRVFEIAEVLPGYFARYMPLYADRAKLQQPMLRHVELGESIRSSLTKLNSSLTDDEKTALEYERQKFLSAVLLKLERNLREIGKCIQEWAT